MADRTVSVSLLARVSGFVNGMNQASKSAGDFGNKISTGALKNKQSLDQLAGTAGIMGAALVGAAGFAVKAFMDFDKQMSGVQAATHATAAEMDELRAAALEAGARTKFSATEAAAGIENLAKAGVSTTDILNGGLNGALDLAAAGELEVADAAEIAATAMTQFKLKGDQLPHVADLLAAGAGKAQGEVSDMAMALKQSGLVAGQFGLSIEETTGTLAAFASAGLLGSDAGTSFRTMLLRMANPAEETAELMQRLGINAYDAQGNFVGMANLAQQLQSKLSGLTQAQRDQALAQIFGSDAIRAANVLYDQGAAGITEWTNKVNDAGYATETAALKMNNLAGDIEAFLGSLETALIGVGEGANGPLRSLTQGATDAVNAFNELPDGVKSSLLAIVGGGGLVLLGVAGLIKLTTVVSETRESLDNLGKTGKVVGGILKFVGVASALAGVAFVIGGLGDEMQGLNATTDELQRNFREFTETGKLSGSLVKLLGDDFEDLGEKAGLVFDASGKQKVDDFLIGWTPIKSEIGRAREAFEKLDETLAAMDPEPAGEAFELLTGKLREQGYSVEQISSLFPVYLDGVKQVATQSGTAAEGVGELAEGAAAVEEAISPAAAALKEMEDRASGLNEQLALLNSTMGGVEAESAYEEAIDAVSDRLAEYKTEVEKGEAGTKGMKGALDLGAQAGRDNAAVLRDLWKRTTDYSSETMKLTGNQNTANSILIKGREKLVDMAVAFTGSRKSAEKYVAEVLGIPKNIATPVTQPGMPAARANAQGLASDVKGVPNNKATSFSTPGIGTAYSRADQYADRLGGIPRTITTSVRVNISGANQRILDRARAGGGPVQQGLPYLVGEEGPELYVPGANGHIIPAGATKRMMTSTTVVQSAPAAAGPTSLEGALYLDSGQFIGIVRGEIRESNRELKRDVTAGAGRRR